MDREKQSDSGISIQASLSGYSFKQALVPRAFFSKDRARELLSAQSALQKEDKVFSAELPQWDSVLLYSASRKEDLPQLYHLLVSLDKDKEYNKVHLAWENGCLSLVIAQGRNLLLANVFAAPDFTTAQYFLFLAMQQFQLNPEVTCISVKTPMTEDEELSLYHYFKAVVKI